MFHFHLTSLRCQDCENGGISNCQHFQHQGWWPSGSPAHSCTLLVYSTKSFSTIVGDTRTHYFSASFLYFSYYLWPHKTFQNEPHSVIASPWSSGFIHFHLAFIHYKLRFLRHEQFTRQTSLVSEFLRSSLKCTVPTLLGGAKFA